MMVLKQVYENHRLLQYIGAHPICFQSSQYTFATDLRMESVYTGVEDYPLWLDKFHEQFRIP